MTKPTPTVLNLSDLPTKRRLMQKISMLTGLYEVTLKPRKLTRSLNQNAYYWVAVVGPFTEWLCENWGESILPEQAHELLKRQILGSREVVNETTGEILEIPPSSKVLDTAEFGEYLEGCIKWLGESFGIIVLDSSLFYEQRQVKAPSLKKALKGSIKLARERKKVG